MRRIAVPRWHDAAAAAAASAAAALPSAATATATCSSTGLAALQLLPEAGATAAGISSSASSSASSSSASSSSATSSSSSSSSANSSSPTSSSRPQGSSAMRLVCRSLTARTTTSGGGGGGVTAAAAAAAYAAAGSTRGFKTGVWDVRGLPRRTNPPYFNPDDGPDAYFYWRDLWRAPQHPPKPRPPRRLPLYLEQEQQDALLAAAVDAGVPEELARGGPHADGSPRQVPRLIAAVQAQAGRIPTDPERLAERVRGLLELQRSVPGLDVLRIFKAHGFGILAEPPSRVARQAAYLGKRLPAAGVAAAEPGVLLTAALKPALHYPAELVDRAQELPRVFQAALQSAPPEGLLQHPFHATLLNHSSTAAQKRMQALADRHGQQAAAAMYARLPQLLHYSPENLDLKTAALAQGLGLRGPAALQLVARQPRLLTHGADVLSARLAGLKALLGLRKQAQLQRLVLQQPSLLHKKTETLAAKLAQLQQVLGVDAAHVAKLAAQQPRLLTYSQQALARPLEQLQAVSEASPLAPAAADARALLLAKPRLLAFNGDAAAGAPPQTSLAGRLQLLEQLAGCGEPWRSDIEQLAGSSSSTQQLAALLAHPAMYARCSWLLQQSGREAGPDNTAGSSEERPAGLLQLLALSTPEFERRWPGFVDSQPARRPPADRSGSDA